MRSWRSSRGSCSTSPVTSRDKEADEVLDDLVEARHCCSRSRPSRRPGTGPGWLRRCGSRPGCGNSSAPQDLTDPPANWWESGPTLVADYRLHVAPRTYPTRERLRSTTALGELADLPGWTAGPERCRGRAGQRPRLARFQVDAAAEIFRALGDKRTQGVIIGAGTGSGKTLAFYLPAFAALAPGLVAGQAPGAHPCPVPAERIAAGPVAGGGLRCPGCC